MTGALLAELPPGLADPVLDAQACFRTVLQALSHPGRVLTLPPCGLAGLRVPAAPGHEAPLAPAAAALLLTLLDAETSVSLVGRLASPQAGRWLRFHTGTALADDATPCTAAHFTVVRADELTPALCSTLPLGSDEQPQAGATLIVEVPALGPQATDRAHALLSLRGPGIPSTRALAVAGVPAGFWHWRAALPAQYPRGLELLLVQGTQIAALPRSTGLAWQPIAPDH